jgi:hypothetical protein
MSNTIDFDRVEVIVKEVMNCIAMCSVDRYTKGDTDYVEDSVDSAFMALSYALPDVVCVDDTVTRRCAKSEIYSVLDQVVAFRAANPGVPFYHLFDSITAESVMDDIIAMNEDDDDDAFDESMFEEVA